MAFIKNIEHSKSIDIKNIVEYQDGKVASLTLCQQDEVGVTLFAFASGEGVSTHSSPGDAMILILDGEAFITIGGVDYIVKEGETIVMPANVPHAVKAEKAFKMLLTVVKSGKCK